MGNKREYFKQYFQNPENTDENKTPTLRDMENRIKDLNSRGRGVHISLFQFVLYGDPNEFNLQNTLLYLKHLYENETGKKYRIDYGLDYDKEGNVFVTYTVIPKGIEYSEEAFKTSGEKMLRYKSINMHKKHMEPKSWYDDAAKMIWDLHYNKHKESIDRKYYDAKLNFRDGSSLEFPVNLAVNVDVNNLGFSGEVKIGEDQYKKVEKLMDAFVFETNHEDDDFVANYLFKLVRRNLICDHYFDSKEFENLTKEYFGVNCNYNKETQKMFKEISYIRCRKNKVKNQ